MEYIFSYGTLQKAEVQQKLFGRLPKGMQDTLDGFKTAEIDIDDPSFLAKGETSRQTTAVDSPGDVIDGTVFEITSDELALVDAYEPHNYGRIAVRLGSGKKAWVYLQKI